MIEKIDRILEINHKSFAKLMNVYAQTDVSNRQFASPICIFFELNIIIYIPKTEFPIYGSSYTMKKKMLSYKKFKELEHGKKVSTNCVLPRCRTCACFRFIILGC